MLDNCKIKLQSVFGIDDMLIRYVEANIIPQYSQFDKAHNLGHVTKVIENSLEIATHYPVDLGLVYVVAAYHDIGLAKGRKDHEKNSAIFLKSDINLEKFFDSEDINLIAEAVEDHRASADHEPRSIYGKIVADADNDLDYKSVFTRCLQYGLATFPEYDKLTHFERIHEHMIDKYGYGSYLKLWLDTERDKRGLQEIRDMLYNKREAMRADFDILWEEENPQARLF